MKTPTLVFNAKLAWMRSKTAFPKGVALPAMRPDRMMPAEVAFSLRHSYGEPA